MSDVKPEGKRAQQRRATRRRIVESALELFLGQGYAATTLEQVAAGAGVAVQTVYFHFGNKRTILIEGIGASVVGDHEQVAMIDRSWAQEALTTADPARALEVWIANGRSIFARVAPLLWIVRDAVGADPDMAREWETNQRQRHSDHQAFAQRLADLDALAPGLSVARATDITYALLSPEMYHLLTVERAWTPAAWESWTRQTLTTSLLNAQA